MLSRLARLKVPPLRAPGTRVGVERATVGAAVGDATPGGRTVGVVVVGGAMMASGAVVVVRAGSEYGEGAGCGISVAWAVGI
jgi:hypothetical protein